MKLTSSFSAPLCDILFCRDQEVSAVFFLAAGAGPPSGVWSLAADSSSLWGNELYEPRRLSHIYYGNLYRKSRRAQLGLHASLQPTCAVGSRASRGRNTLVWDVCLCSGSEPGLSFSAHKQSGPRVGTWFSLSFSLLAKIYISFSRNEVIWFAVKNVLVVIFYETKHLEEDLHVWLSTLILKLTRSFWQRHERWPTER